MDNSSMVEHSAVNRKVVGSTPTYPAPVFLLRLSAGQLITIIFYSDNRYYFFKRIATVRNCYIPVAVPYLKDNQTNGDSRIDYG